VVRSLRHGRRKALKKGQELLVNYNVPHYSPLDWFVSLGFVPSERQGQWQKVDAALPRVRQDSYGVGANDPKPTVELWEEEYEPQIMEQWKAHQKKKKQQRVAASNGGGASSTSSNDSAASSASESKTSTTSSGGNQESQSERK
jgi:hypothetical protein